MKRVTQRGDVFQVRALDCHEKQIACAVRAEDSGGRFWIVYPSTVNDERLKTILQAERALRSIPDVHRLVRERAQ